MFRTAVAACALLAAPAFADETWTNSAGPLVYEADLGHVAVLPFPTAATPLAQAGGGPRANVYFPVLAAISTPVPFMTDTGPPPARRSAPRS